MQVDINKDWRITTDSMNWILQKRYITQTGKKKGEIRWESEAYCGSLGSLLNHYLDKRTKDNDAGSIAEIVNIIEEVREEIIELTEPLRRLNLE